MYSKVVSNILSVISGRLFVSISRFVISVIIVRFSGANTFGSYAVIISILFIFEWLMDFGITDIAVRNIAQEKDYTSRIIHSVVLIKVFQLILSILLLGIAINLLGYKDLFASFAVGAIALLFYGIALIYRIIFRVNLTNQNDIIAESVGVLIMIFLVIYFSVNGSSVTFLVASHTISRIIYCFLSIYLGSKEFIKPEKSNSGYTSPVSLAKQAWPLGIAGIFVASYDSVMPIVLSKLVSMEAVAYYTVSLRLIFPAVVIAQAIASVYYTPLSRYWNKNKESFIDTQQQLVQVVSLVVCLIFCGVYSGADFLFSIFGEEIANSSYILKLISIAILGRSLTIAMAGPLIICGGQRKMLFLTILTILFSVFLILFLVPRYGINGAAYAYLLVEIVLTGIPTALWSQYLARFRLRWLPIFKIFLSALCATQLIGLTQLDGTFVAALISGLIFMTLVLMLGGITVTQLKAVYVQFSSRKRN